MDDVMDDIDVLWEKLRGTADSTVDVFDLFELVDTNEDQFARFATQVDNVSTLRELGQLLDRLPRDLPGWKIPYAKGATADDDITIQRLLVYLKRQVNERPDAAPTQEERTLAWGIGRHLYQAKRMAPPLKEQAYKAAVAAAKKAEAVVSWVPWVVGGTLAAATIIGVAVAASDRRGRRGRR